MSTTEDDRRDSKISLDNMGDRASSVGSGAITPRSLEDGPTQMVDVSYSSIPIF
jgi:hypothetical protein